MTPIAKFEKVSFEQFKKDWKNQTDNGLTDYEDAELQRIYDAITIPMRSTEGSAGYDFKAPVGFCIPWGKSLVIPTGIRCRIDNGWFLDLNPRSGQGFKYGIRLANTRGIIDSDYYGADNEGHIMVKLVNESVLAEHKDFTVSEGQAFAQGIFTIFGTTEDDVASGKRLNGFGSTDKRKE